MPRDGGLLKSHTSIPESSHHELDALYASLSAGILQDSVDNENPRACGCRKDIFVQKANRLYEFLTEIFTFFVPLSNCSRVSRKFWGAVRILFEVLLSSTGCHQADITFMQRTQNLCCCDSRPFCPWDNSQGQKNSFIVIAPSEKPGSEKDNEGRILSNNFRIASGGKLIDPFQTPKAMCVLSILQKAQMV
ncbi:hypothetical protein BDW69DRAFT_146201 [Aspergillus filifer]